MTASGCWSCSGGWVRAHEGLQEGAQVGRVGRGLQATRVQVLELSRRLQGEPWAKGWRVEWTRGGAGTLGHSLVHFHWSNVNSPAWPLHFLPGTPENHLCGPVHEWGGAAGKWTLAGRVRDFRPSCHPLLPPWATAGWSNSGPQPVPRQPRSPEALQVWAGLTPTPSEGC